MALAVGGGGDGIEADLDCRHELAPLENTHM